MDQKNSRPEFSTDSSPGGGSLNPKPNSVGDALNRGKDAISDAAHDAEKSSGSDLQAIQNDLNSLKETLSRFMSQAGTQAVKSARDATSNLAGQVGDAASDLADRGSQLVSTAGDQAKTFASELESMARRNPLGRWLGRSRSECSSELWDGAADAVQEFLKLLGLDVHAKIAEARLELEQRVEEASDYAKKATLTAALVGAFSAIAALLAIAAIGVGVFALYRVTAEHYGVYAGLGAVAGLLIGPPRHCF